MPKKAIPPAVPQEAPLPHLDLRALANAMRDDTIAILEGLREGNLERLEPEMFAELYAVMLSLRLGALTHLLGPQRIELAHDVTALAVAAARDLTTDDLADHGIELMGVPGNLALDVGPAFRRWGTEASTWTAFAADGTTSSTVERLAWCYEIVVGLPAERFTQDVAHQLRQLVLDTTSARIRDVIPEWQPPPGRQVL